MTNYWAIAIGINQYQCFQPLMYAQRDAQALWNFWVNDRAFTQDHCLLLTDSSPGVDSSSSYPSRENIEHSIAHIGEQLQENDVLWCFFSGYGVRFQGKDYLMPIEGDPHQIAATGISVESLFDSFQHAPTQNILLILDVNRSQSAASGNGMGQETITLADRYNVATLLSCLPEQFSHETLALRHGLFTAALVEGLRFQSCATVAQLAAYMRDRLPEISEHHWRPRQDPVAIVSHEKEHLILLPTRVAAAVGSSPGQGYINRAEGDGSPSHLNGYPNSSDSMRFPASTGTPTNGFKPTTTNGYSANGTAPPTSHSSLLPVSDRQETTEPDDRFWQTTLPWLFGITALLVVAVLFQNQAAFNNQPDPSAPLPQPPSAPSGAANSGTVSHASPNSAAQWLSQPNPAPSRAISAHAKTVTSAPSPSPPSTENPQIFTSLMGSSSSTPVPSPAVSSSPTPAPPESIPSLAPAGLAAVRVALQIQQYGEATRLLDQLPAAQRTGDYAQLLLQTNQGLLSQARTSLTRSRAVTATNQASDFSTAIQIASRIKQGHPLYQDAQQTIDRWGQMILDLARSRASQPNYGSSLTAAQNYRAAINAAILVPPNRAQLYATAQEFIAQWSQSILNLAQNHAAQGNLDIAIKTAQLIPGETLAYSPAQNAIAQWKTQLGY